MPYIGSGPCKTCNIVNNLTRTAVYNYLRCPDEFTTVEQLLWQYSIEIRPGDVHTLEIWDDNYFTAFNLDFSCNKL